jgi:carboxymethylenebutenolidase
VPNVIRRGLSGALVLLLPWVALPAPAAIPVAPTAPGEIPAAIRGEAGPPAGERVAYFDEDPATSGYLAVPAGGGSFPAVVLIHEWDGLGERVMQTADAFAAEGYVALAADLYAGRTGSSREENMALVRETRADPDRIVRNLEAAVDFLKRRGDTQGRVAAIGWCFGGGVALSFALGSDSHHGTAIFYGSLLADPERLAAINHEVYGTFAGEDRGIPPEEVERFVTALRAAGIENDVHVYDDVRHGFWLHVDRDPATGTAPALDAWRRLKAYLERVLGDR